MRLSKICIERPVFATVLSLILLVFGYIGISHLETRYFPVVKQPFAEVSVHYPGASPQVMQTEVTHYLQNALINIDNLTSLRSRSTFHDSHIYLRFAPGTNMIKAMGDVRDQVSSVRDQLPVDADPPSITSGGVARPVLNIGFLDNSLSQAKIRDYVTQVITPQLTNLPGMGAVWAYGASSYALRIWLDPQKMAALGVTVTDIQNALEANNINFSGGSIRGRARTYSLVADTQLHTPAEFANMIIADVNGQIVRLGQVAQVELGSSSLDDSPMRIDGKNAIDLEIRPLDSANPITVAKEAKTVLAQIQKRLPDGMSMVITYDQSQYLQSAIHESVMTLIEAVLLVMLVVYLFLGTVRASLIPIVTIPVCVIAVFGVMLLFGFSINVITLLAIIMAIGLVVDDAIVMLENIHRHIERGAKPLEAALKGSKEIGFSVIAMTLTLAAVYAPTGFVSGFSASVFREFGFTLAGAVLISGFVALTLSPMMCSRILHSRKELSKMERWLDKTFSRVNQQYQQRLTQFIKRRWYLVGGLVFLAIVGYGFYRWLPQEFIPKEDIGYFTVNVTMPPGSTVPYTNHYMSELEKLYAKTPQIQSYASFIFSGSATNFVTMKPWGERDLSTQQVINQLMPAIDKIPVLIDVSVPDPVSYGPDTGGKPVNVRITTLGSYQDLQKTVDKLKTIFSHYPGMSNVTSNLKFDNQVFEVSFKRNEAAELGVNLQNVADTFSVMLAGKHITDINRNGQTYQVLVQMNLKDLSSFEGLNNIYVPTTKAPVIVPGATPASPASGMVPLANLVTLHPAARQSNLYEYNRRRSADITAQLANGYSLGQVVSYIHSVLGAQLTPVESYAFGGRIDAFLQSQGTMLSLFALSLLFIYLVLAAQFESFVDPLIILLTVPLSIVGALFTLKVTGGSVNLYTNIGMITLVGLITKHGILITQFANEQLKQGEKLIQAISRGAVTRLRPILMTTFAMVLGALPLALASGPGSISHNQIGWVIVGGMLFGTFFSLIVVPIAYYLLAPFDHKKKKLIRLNETATS